MKIINNDFYTNNWQDFVHRWVMQKVDQLVQRYNLPIDVDTIETVRIDTTEDDTNNFVFTYTKDGLEHTFTITTKPGEVEISISDNSTWVVNGEDTGKNTAGQMGLVGDRGPQGITGDKGPQGIKGKTGVQGSKGERGETGDKGTTGEIGERGPQGLQGKKGLQGEPGERGVAGPQGEKGLQGEPGEKGEPGDKGPQGIAGTVTGDKGPTGPVGPKGEPGDKGPTGSKGPQGVIGETGDKGPTGDRGEQGPQGDRGEQGPQGPIGDKGPKGETPKTNVSIGENEHFYVDNVDTNKPSRGEPGKLTGVNKDNYVKQMYDTIGYKENDVYSCLGTNYTVRNYGYIDTTLGSDSGNDNYTIPTRSDKNFYGLSSTPSSSIKIFSISVTKVNRKLYGNNYYPSSNGIYCVPFGINCMSQLVSDTRYQNYTSSWAYLNGSPFYLKNNDILQGIAIQDYNKWEFTMKPYTMGIVKQTDENGNVRTFQCCGVLHRYASSGSGSGFRYCIVLRQYKKGPQAQWSSTFSVNSSYYCTKVEFIDNDGNPIDFENGGLIVSHDPDYFTSLWQAHKDEMNV